MVFSEKLNKTITFLKKEETTKKKKIKLNDYID